uniref:Septin n=1 Tax=Syphacia muris TaxID=451379 RepID=A0A0N5AQL5_9BILA
MRGNFDGSMAGVESAPTNTLRSDVSNMSKRSGNTKDAHSYVGFANFPNQVFRRAVKNGFELTLMVVGQSGLGKSTFLNSLFATDIYPADASKCERIPSTTQINEQSVRLVEKGVTLNLTLVDCPGYGDGIDNNKCWDPIVEYIEQRYLDYFSEETKIERSPIIPDKRVHLCLYFIAPTGHGLKPLDIEFMKKLHGRVNVIPVIAKADTMTRDELLFFKRQILKEIEENNIKLYKFPDTDDEEEKRQFGPLKERVPFAVAGSNLIKEINGRKVRVREYPWGVVQVENLEHNDFIALRHMIIRTNLIDLISVTHNVHYENFRFRQMSKASKGAGDQDPFTQMEQDRNQKEKELEVRKVEMEKIFNVKVSEREAKLVAKQKELDELEKENNAKLHNRREDLNKLLKEVSDLRRNVGSISRQDSRSSSSRAESSPQDKKSKKTLGIF